MKCKFCSNQTERTINDIPVCRNHTLTIETGKGKSKYKVSHRFSGVPTSAVAHFNGLNTHSGHKKRLRIDGAHTIARVIT